MDKALLAGGIFAGIVAVVVLLVLFTVDIDGSDTYQPGITITR
jgi:hypothetical protein